MKNNIKAYSYEEIISLFANLKQPRYRADQLVNWLYSQGVSNYDEMSNLPKKLREYLSQEYPINFPLVVNKQISRDGTRKYVLEFSDGAQVETVAIPSREATSSLPHPSDKTLLSERTASTTPTVSAASSVPAISSVSAASSVAAASPSTSTSAALATETAAKRLTVCVSTQSGCSMECSFCATGKEGLTRSLLAGEIVDQVLVVQKDMNMRVSNVVTMGQGEPFLNYDNTLAALRFLNSPQGLEIGARHITLSTCGLIDGITRLSKETEQFTLAVSLHSAKQNTRDSLMPRMKHTRLPELKEALLNYVAQTKRRVSLEYILIDGVNDSQNSLDALVGFCDKLLCHVNLLPINAVKGSGYQPSSPARIKAWLSRLEKAHIPATVRESRGSDIAGACGQLKNSLGPR